MHLYSSQRKYFVQNWDKCNTIHFISETTSRSKSKDKEQSWYIFKNQKSQCSYCKRENIFKREDMRKLQ